MYIKVTNISDFLSFILNSFGNDEKNIRVFISDEEPYWGFVNDDYNVKINNNVKVNFTYVLFTHLYKVIYTDSVKDDEYSNILNLLKNYQNHFEKPFSITRFENIKFNETLNQLLIENELNTF